jgi:CDP-glycerol glycerophosphotransferase (TagB/SpsB family)
MIEMAKKYQDSVQFVFKPHPVLRSKLVVLWGEEKTNAYYNTWDSLPNSTIHEDEYIDLFLTSDAMIHDSGSFTVEYLYVNKPVMRTVSDLPLNEQFNQFIGRENIDLD